MSGFREMRAYLGQMSEEQAAGALIFDRSSMLIAGAGSGKTRAVVSHVAKAMLPYEEGGFGVSPKSIMMLTFTNKAAREMMERLSPLQKALASNGIYGDPWVGTFHSIAMRILREEARHTGLGKNFSILDDDDAKEVMNEAFEASNTQFMDRDAFKAGLQFVKANLYQPKLLLARKATVDKINALKNEGKALKLTPVQEEWVQIFEKKLPQGFEKAYEAYQEILLRNNAVDFSDLINKVTYLFRENPMIKLSWQSRFRHIIVDEGQDMNPAQEAFLREITGLGMTTMFDPEGREENVFGEVQVTPDGHMVNLENLRDFPWPIVMVVGDLRQSIYGFNGSEPEKLARLPEIFVGDEHAPPMKMVELRESYRCPPPILNAANRLISNNGERFGSGMIAMKSGESAKPLEIRRFSKWDDEFRYIADNLKEKIANGVTPGHVGIITRTRAFVRELSAFLRGEGIPVSEGKATDVRSSKEVKDIMAYANFLVNPSAEMMLRRIINRPTRRIGKNSVGAVITNARLKNISFVDELRFVMNSKLPQKEGGVQDLFGDDLGKDEKFVVEIPDGGQDYSQEFIKASKAFGLLIVKMRHEIGMLDAEQALEMIMEKTGYLDGLKDDALSPLNLEAKLAKEIKALPIGDFLARVIGLKAAERGNEKAEDVAEMRVEDVADKAGNISEAMRRIGNMMILLDQAKGVSNLHDFVQNAALEMSQEHEAPGVQVMTIHSSKGKEFKHVYLPGCHQGHMPHYNSMQGEGLREERRLFYVGVTRGEEEVVITQCANTVGMKAMQGKTGPVKPSQFLAELVDKSLEVVCYDEFGVVIPNERFMQSAENAGGAENAGNFRENNRQWEDASAREARRGPSPWRVSRERAMRGKDNGEPAF